MEQLRTYIKTHENTVIGNNIQPPLLMWREKYCTLDVLCIRVCLYVLFDLDKCDNVSEIISTSKYINCLLKVFSAIEQKRVITDEDFRSNFPTVDSVYLLFQKGLINVLYKYRKNQHF